MRVVALASKSSLSMQVAQLRDQLERERQRRGELDHQLSELERRRKVFFCSKDVRRRGFLEGNEAKTRLLSEAFWAFWSF